MDEVNKAVVFAILMENNRGIVDKAPGYVMEKWAIVKTMDNPERLLDSNNLKKFEDWKYRWHVSQPEE